MTRILIIISSVILCSCSSIPLSTMLELSTFDENNFLALKPSEVKAKIHIDAPIEINVAKTQLSITLGTAQGDIIQNYPLESYAIKTLPAENSWFNTLPQRTEYELILSKEAINNFQIAQNKMKAEELTGLSFTVLTNFSGVTTEHKSTSMSIFVKLKDNSDNYPDIGGDC